MRTPRASRLRRRSRLAGLIAISLLASPSAGALGSRHLDRICPDRRYRGNGSCRY